VLEAAGILAVVWIVAVAVFQRAVIVALWKVVKH
jgi:hypothetical protein